jgi:Ca-activated chloride channel homolog
MVTLGAPLFLLLLIPLAALIVVAGRQPGGAGHSVALALRCASLALLIVALTQPTWAAGRAAPVLFVVDRSASIPPAMRAHEEAWLRGALDTIAPGAGRGVVTFAGGARLALLPARPGAVRLGAAPDAGHTDIAGALRLALSAAPAGARLISLSDGLQTMGDARAVAAAARARHVTVDTVVLGGHGVVDAALTRLQAAAALHQGDTLPLLLTVRSTVARRATVSLAQDGRLVGQESLPLRRGDNPFLLPLSAPGPGWHSYRAAVSMRGDAVAQNNALDTTTRVIGRPRILVVAGDPGHDPFAALLRRLGFDVLTATPRSLPASAGVLARYDGLVLDDVPAAALGARSVAALETAVRTGGLGLLVLGGPHSLTLGGYAQTSLDRLLPVSSIAPGSRQGNVALELVLDRSGSMNNLAGDEPKIVMTQAAANLAVDFATQHKDDLGIVAFDIDSHIVVPLQKVATRSSAVRIHHTVNALTADGGTDIYDALRTGLNQVLRSAAPYKHIVLMTDGVSEPGPYNRLLNLMARRAVTLSTIGLGMDADVNLLRSLANEGKGRFYYTNDASTLPRIFLNEAQLSAGPVRVVGTIPVASGAGSPVLRSLVGSPLPPVHGYPATTLKPDATPDLVTHASGHGADPLLAQWQYGLGRVLVWTPGATTWAGAWLTTESSMWADAVRWILRGVPTPALEPHLLPGDPPLRVEVDTLQNSGAFVDLVRLSGSVRLPRGARRPLTVEQVGPARYETSLPDGGPGVYHLTVHQETAPYGQVDAALAVPYPAEYLPRPPDLALLSQIAALTGGHVLHDPGQLKGTSIAGEDLWWPLAALALLLFLSDVTLRLVGRDAVGRRPI